jgi:hypothetical protein
MAVPEVRLPETIDITPNWPGMFRLAIQLCRDSMGQGEGREVVVMMLEFGARLEEERRG